MKLARFLKDGLIKYGIVEEGRINEIKGTPFDGIGSLVNKVKVEV